MEDKVYKLTEIVGTSNESIETAISTAIARASTSIRHVRCFEVLATRGFVELTGAIQYQVTLKIGFTLES